METSYTYARNHLAELWDKAIADCEPVVVKRRGHPDLALIAADELASLRDTAYLFASPENARRLLEARESLERGEGTQITIEELRRELGLQSA